MPISATLTEMITFEQPLNEPMRICLRLEHLLSQFKQHSESSDPSSSRLAMSALVKTLDVINRPDFKSKLTQTLTSYATTLAQLEQFPQVDSVRLKKILEKLDTLILNFHDQQQRVGERLRNNEFINQLRLRQGNPGGVPNYSTPAYALWLHQPPIQRIQDLKEWSSEFSELYEMVDLILYLTRSSSEGQKVLARGGFYQQNLNPALPCEIVRINVPIHYHVFPEFSVGKHRLAIRFLTPLYHNNGRAIAVNNDIEFELSCCRV